MKILLIYSNASAKIWSIWEMWICGPCAENLWLIGREFVPERDKFLVLGPWNCGPLTVNLCPGDRKIVTLWLWICPSNVNLWPSDREFVSRWSQIYDSLIVNLCPSICEFVALWPEICGPLWICGSLTKNLWLTDRKFWDPCINACTVYRTLSEWQLNPFDSLRFESRLPQDWLWHRMLGEFKHRINEREGTYSFTWN